MAIKKNVHYLVATFVAIMLFLFAHSSTIRASGLENDDLGTRKKSVMEGKYITVIIPSDAAEIVRALVARLDEIFDFLCQEADYTPRKKLVVNLSDEFDLLNGWASSLPRPVVELNLCAGSYGEFFSASDRRLEFIAIHEFTHILNMEPNYKFRGFLEDIFGRIIPTDPLSLLLFYLSTPPQITMPRFWLEGMAQWAETKYSPTDSIWGGRGRDTYTHMIWRLDAAEGEIPEVGDWRLSYIHWPYGSRSYHYGLAYTRYLDGAYGDKASIWELALSQTENWPFSFKRGAFNIVYKNHGVLLKEARSALLKEQDEILQKLRSVPLTSVQRLTPEDYIFGAPAWTSDGHLFACAYDPFASRKRYVYIDNDGNLKASPLPAHEITAVRRSSGGSMVTSNLVKTIKNRLRSRISIIRPSGKIINFRLRLAQPDLAEGTFQDADGLVALHFTAGGRQELCFYRVDDKNIELVATLPSEGTPWEPIFRPGNDGPPREIAWIESYENRTELILAPIEDLSKRQKLLSLKGRIIHPCWSSDGSELFYCSDVTGVSNAYRLNVSPEGIPLSINPITHTIGGVLACVPSPDGKEFAIIDHDRRGPFIARIPNNANKDTGRLPEITIAWPAPVKKDRPVDTADTFIDPPKKNNYPTLHEYSYNGLSHLEFQYWTPTTMVTDTGGIGLQIAFGDPIWNHRIIAGIGSGYETDKAVGQAYYSYFGLARTNVLLTGYGLESTFTDRVTSSFGELYNYTEYITGGNVSLGFELSGIERHLEAIVGVGYRDAENVESVSDLYAHKTIISLPPFEGVAKFVQAGLYYNDTTFYPTSYNPEDGLLCSLFYRQSGYSIGGDLDQQRALGEIGYIFTIAPRLGHQIEARGIAGWSDGDRYLQGAFTIGGASYDGIETPRGYYNTMDTGPYLGAYTAAYRLPLYRPFKGFGTTPFEIRQIVLEGFFDAGSISPDEPFGEGEWFRSAGLELTLDMRFFDMPLRPGFQFAKQLDGNKDSTLSIVLHGLF